MGSEKTTFKRGRQAELLQYVIEQGGRHVTISELEQKFGQYDRTSIMASMANLGGRAKEKYNYPITRVAQGVWKFDEAKDPANDSRPQELPRHEPTPFKGTTEIPVEYAQVPKDIYDMNVTVIKSTDDGNELVAVDDFTNIWRMVKAAV